MGHFTGCCFLHYVDSPIYSTTTPSLHTHLAFSPAQTYSFNALFVSMRSQQQPRIPLRMAVLNLVHELMHSFGAKHDPAGGGTDGGTDGGGAGCTPADADINGRYLMSRFSNTGRRINHELLSSCTKKSVVEVLEASHRTRCLREVARPYCGDGVVQEGEECDCGTTYNCLKMRSECNTPHGNECSRH